MKLGVLTTCLPEWSLDCIALFAKQQGSERLEVGVWPDTGGRDFEAAHPPAVTFAEDDAAATRELLDRTGLEISVFADYEDNRHQDRDRRAAVKAHQFHAVDAAQARGVPYIVTFIGRDNTKSVREDTREGNRLPPELVDYAGERGVRLVIENCVIEGWHLDGYPGNLAYSPELWKWVTGLGFGLNWDPSHLTWIGIDPVETILPFAENIVHAQAKDVELSHASATNTGSSTRATTAATWAGGSSGGPAAVSWTGRTSPTGSTRRAPTAP